MSIESKVIIKPLGIYLLKKFTSIILFRLHRLSLYPVPFQISKIHKHIRISLHHVRNLKKSLALRQENMLTPFLLCWVHNSASNSVFCITRVMALTLTWTKSSAHLSVYLSDSSRLIQERIIMKGIQECAATMVRLDYVQMLYLVKKISTCQT